MSDENQTPQADADAQAAAEAAAAAQAQAEAQAQAQAQAEAAAAAAAQEAAKAKSGRPTKARVLQKCEHGLPNDVVTLPESVAKAAEKAGLVDTDKAAVAYAARLPQNQ